MTFYDFSIALIMVSIPCIIIYLMVKWQKAKASDEIKTIKLTNDQVEKDINSIDLSDLIKKNNSETKS